VAVSLDLLVKTLLDAPVGHVEQTISDILKMPARLDVIEQNATSGTEYTRKIVIMSGQFPIVCATVRFDSKILPKHVMSDLLQKKEGIGNILRKYCITAQRDSVVLDFSADGKKVTRTYKILFNNSIWFQVSEEMQLDFLCACQNG
jgi:chorismate-pyruvate lyase